jgi:hypothetical protein
MVAPLPVYALPLIQAAIKRLRSSAPKERQRRKGNSLVDALATTILSAYVDLTGKPAPKAVLWDKPSLSSPLIQLARDIDRHFSLHLFGATDSRRLRKLTTNAH